MAVAGQSAIAVDADAVAGQGLVRWRRTIGTVAARSTTGPRLTGVTRSASANASAWSRGFGWGKMVGPIRKAKHRGRRRVGWMFTFTQAAYNLVRMRPLLCPS